MRVSFRLLLVALLVFCYASPASASALFTTNLFLGSRGAQVILLQQILNRDPDTRIASTGPGSPGKETIYFGSLTKSAVIRFQEKYAETILYQNGLTKGTGIVGISTRAKLALLGDVSAPMAVTYSTPSIATASLPPPIPPTSTTTSQNPNLKNLDKFLSALDTVAAKQNVSSTNLAAIKEQIMKDVATTTDLRTTFLKMVPDKSSLSIRNDSYVGKMLATIKQVFQKVFLPEHAYAATGVPFGGALLYPFYCTQSNTWLITITPLPPSYAAILTYIPGSQAFLSYNIPITNWLLGEYEPGAGVCIAGYCPYCVTIPSEGMITPMVGSSLL
jgi:hypothetical protein